MGYLVKLILNIYNTWIIFSDFKIYITKNEYFIAKFLVPNLKYIKYILKLLEYYNIVTLLNII